MSGFVLVEISEPPHMSACGISTPAVLPTRGGPTTPTESSFVPSAKRARPNQSRPHPKNGRSRQVTRALPTSLQGSNLGSLYGPVERDQRARPKSRPAKVKLRTSSAISIFPPPDRVAYRGP